MTTLSDQLRTFVDGLANPGVPETARTNRTNAGAGGDDGISAISTRDRRTCHLAARFDEDSLFVYQERLAIADDLGLDANPGSPAEETALREARSVAAGLPGAWPCSREATIVDVLLAEFEPMGGLRCAGRLREANKGSEA